MILPRLLLGIRCVLLLRAACTHSFVIVAGGFQRLSDLHGGAPKRRGNRPVRLAAAAALGDLSTPRPPPLDPKLFEAASALLPWEKAIEKEQEPVLNLSRRDGDNDEALSLSEEAQEEVRPSDSSSNRVPAAEEAEEPPPGVSSWQDGSLWAATRAGLVDLSVLPRDTSNGADPNYGQAANQSELRLLERVPQLLRLETVVPTAETALAMGLPAALLRNEPELLSYTPQHLEGGVDFLATMMMMPENRQGVLAACRATPGLLVGAVDGYIQEQTVQRALGNAAEATSKANQHMAAHVSKAYRSIKGIEHK